MPPTIQQLWSAVEFEPNDEQKRAILADGGPLYLTAGPGSGKTRVLLWRTVNLIVFHEIAPERIFLGTFTEKGAHQLREGLRGYLAIASERTGKPYDISKMAIGTIHSNCHRILESRALTTAGRRPRSPILLDEFKQYRTVYARRFWTELVEASGLGADPEEKIIRYLARRAGSSRHDAVRLAIAFFNRCAEECIDPSKARLPDDEVGTALLRMCVAYRSFLARDPERPLTDLSLLQQHAYDRLFASQNGSSLFDHVIVDEYQDTNVVQERIYFRLASRSKNLCVVGDDDQALYRFRGATVDNFLAFPDKCKAELGRAAQQISLVTNYRSRRNVVSFANAFIAQTQWTIGKRTYRVDKTPHAASKDGSPAVFVASGAPDDVAAEVAKKVKELIRKKRVKDPNEIAFLFPSLQSESVQRHKRALEAEGLKVYAPRAGAFLNTKEALDVFGVYLNVFGKPEHVYPPFAAWLDGAELTGKALLREDAGLARYVRDRRAEIHTVLSDEETLLSAASTAGFEADDEWSDRAKDAMKAAPGLSDPVRRFFGSRSLDAYVRHQRERRPDRIVTVQYVVNRACSLDWGVLDLFYELTAFEAFKAAFDLAEEGSDEGPICNLSLISDYVARYQEETSPVITAQFLRGGTFANRLFSNYLYSIFRLAEGEYEDDQDPFPRGRIPFLTVHQAKGLEFPVVVLGNTRKQTRDASQLEVVARKLRRAASEPLTSTVVFDIARMFYVALTRPKQALIVCAYRGRGQAVNHEFDEPLRTLAKPVAELDAAAIEPDSKHGSAEYPRPYSFTGDYIGYKICPRRYMMYRRYDFAPSRAQTMVFGNLVHQTIEDLHQWIIQNRTARGGVA